MSFEPPQDTISVDHCLKDRSDKRALKFWSLNIEDIQQNGAVGFEKAMNAIRWHFMLSAEEYSVSIHAPKECHKMLTANDFLPGGRFDPVHQDRKLVVYAHFTPLLKAKASVAVNTSAFIHPVLQIPASKIDYRLAMAHPMGTKIPQPTLDPPSTPVAASHVTIGEADDAADATKTLTISLYLSRPNTNAMRNSLHWSPPDPRVEYDYYPQQSVESPIGVTYLRIGTQSSNSELSSEPGMSDMISVIVAEIQREPRTTRFLAVPSWNINGTMIGSYAKAKVLEDVEYSGLIQDPFFANRDIAQLKEAVLFPLDIINPRERPQDAPIKLIYADAAFSSTCDMHNLEAGEISAVVDIIDKNGLAKGIDLRENFQVAFEISKTFDEVLEHFRGSDIEEERLEGTRTFGELLREVGGRMEIWVLPQNSSTMLYRWHEKSGYTIGSFLDEGAWGSHKQLFIEVHIMRDHGARLVRNGGGGRWKGKGLALR